MNRTRAAAAPETDLFADRLAQNQVRCLLWLVSSRQRNLSIIIAAQGSLPSSL